MTEPSEDQPAGPQGVEPELFHQIYEGEAPWDTGRPQPAVLELIEDDAFRSPLLDLGCGTGENALRIAASGCKVLGVDLVPRAVELAKEKASTRSVAGATFEVGDALALGLPRRFATVLDAAVFHVFSDDDRPRYAESVASVLAEGGLLHVFVFTENLGGGGPRRVSQDEIRSTFGGEAWRIEAIELSTYETRTGEKEAWHARIRRL